MSAGILKHDMDKMRIEEEKLRGFRQEESSIEMTAEQLALGH